MGTEVQEKNLESIKEELAAKYISEYKKELNILEQAGIFLIEKKLKNLLLQQEELPESYTALTISRLEEKLIMLAPKGTVERVYTFLKEKQKLILLGDTKEKLEQLKQGIVPQDTETTENESSNAGDEAGGENRETKSETELETEGADSSSDTGISSDTEQDSIPAGESEHHAQHLASGHHEVGGYATMGTGAALDISQKISRDGLRMRGKTLIEGSHLKQAEKLAESMNAQNAKQGLRDITNALKARRDSGMLLPKQQKAIDKTIRLIDDAAKHTDSMSDLAVRKKLMQEGKLSEHIFGSASAKTIQALAHEMQIFQQSPKAVAGLKKLVTKGDRAAAKALLQQHGVQSLSDDILEELMRTKGDDEAVEGLLRILSKGEAITKLAHVTRFLPFLDLAFYGVEVRDFATNKEADAIRNLARRDNAKDRAARHVGIDTVGFGIPAVWATSAAVYGLYTGLAAAGPAGWVIIGGVAAAEGVKFAADALYFDVVDFYSQDTQDFMGQTQAQIKQAIVQTNYSALYHGNGGKLALNDRELFGGGSKNQRIHTMSEALEAIVSLQEQQSHPSLEQSSGLSSAEKRMLYLQAYCAGGTYQDLFQKSLDEGTGMTFLDTILAESIVYAEMLDTKAISEKEPVPSQEKLHAYLQQKKQELFDKNPLLAKDLDALYKTNPPKFAEMVTHIRRYKQAIDADPAYASVQPTVDFIDAFAHIYQAGTSHSVSGVSENVSLTNYSMIDTFVRDIAAGKSLQTRGESIPEKNVKALLTVGFAQGSQESQYFLQTPEYSNSPGQNVLYRLAKELYSYTGGNDIRALQAYFADTGDSKKKNALGIYFNSEKQQWKVNEDYAKDKTIDLYDVEKFSVDEVMYRWFPMLVLQQNPDAIDTATESTDDLLNTEFVAKIRALVTEEKARVSEKNKTVVQNNIRQYLTDHATSGYVQLPFYLVEQAHRAGLGEFQYFYFSLDAQKTISALARHEYVSKQISLPGVQKVYIDETQPECQKEYEMIDRDKVVIHSFAENQGAALASEAVNTLTTKIQHTASKLTRQGKRGGITYDPLTQELKSFDSGVKVEHTATGNRLVDSPALDIRYRSMDEALAVANFINWFRSVYMIEHPECTLQYGSLLGVRGGLFDTNTGFRGFDDAILSSKAIQETFSETFTITQNREIFINYLTTHVTQMRK